MRKLAWEFARLKRIDSDSISPDGSDLELWTPSIRFAEPIEQAKDGSEIL